MIIVEKKQKELSSPKRKNSYNVWMTFGLNPALFCIHLLWQAAMTIGNPLLVRVAHVVLFFTLAMAIVLYLVYIIPKGLWKMNFSDPVTRQCCNLMLGLYMTSLLSLCIVFEVIPETMTWAIALVPVTFCLAIIGVCLWYYHLYMAERGAHLYMVRYEKYLAYLLASETIITWFMLTLAVHALYQVMDLMVSEGMYVWFGRLFSFMWLMMPVWIVFELCRLPRRHEQIMQSQPKIDRFVRTVLGSEGAVAVFLVPLIKKLLYILLPVITADGIFVSINLVLALVIAGTVIYFSVYKAKYIKASTLSW